MFCQMCGSKTTVVDSRTKSYKTGKQFNYVKRRRRCLNCGHRQNTYETFEKPHSIVEVLNALTFVKEVRKLLQGKN